MCLPMVPHILTMSMCLEKHGPTRAKHVILDGGCFGYLCPSLCRSYTRGHSGHPWISTYNQPCAGSPTPLARAPFSGEPSPFLTFSKNKCTPIHPKTSNNQKSIAASVRNVVDDIVRADAARTLMAASYPASPDQPPLRRACHIPPAHIQTTRSFRNADAVYADLT